MGHRGDRRARWGVGWAMVALSLVGCGKPVTDFGPYGSYVSEFERHARRLGKPVRINDLIIETAVLEPKITADCTRGSMMTPTIRINERILDRASPTTIKLALFHEMGHCVLDRKHTTERLSSGAPASIMYPTNVFVALYNRNSEYYLAELFGAPALETPTTRRWVTAEGHCQSAASVIAGQ